MGYYETKGELLEEVRKRADGALYWTEPYYTELDLQDLLQAIKTPIRQRRRRRKRATKRKLWMLQQSAQVIDVAQSLSQTYRRLLGLDAPIPLEKTREFFVQRDWVRESPIEKLIELAAKKNQITDSQIKKTLKQVSFEKPTFLVYPVLSQVVISPHEQRAFGVRYCKADRVRLVAKTAEAKEQITFLEDFVKTTSAWLSVHPALALALLLSDLPVYDDWVTIVEYQGMFTINVQSRHIPPWLVSRIYSIARAPQVNKKTDGGSSPTPRRRRRTTTGRVSTLITFIEDSEANNWEACWQEWNTLYPQWDYKDVNSMRTVYYRAVRADTTQSKVDSAIREAIIADFESIRKDLEKIS